MRATIELLSGNADQSILDYLNLVDSETARKDLAANLLGFPGSAEMLEQVKDLDKDELFELVQYEDTMSTLGIRLKLLDCTNETHHTLIEEGV